MTQPIRSESGRVVPLTVSMTGPTAVGKSQLAKLTAALLSDAVASRVPADYFLVPRPDDVPIGDFLRRPIAWDWPLLDRLLAQPLGTEATTPDVDFATFARRSATGGLPVVVRPVMLVDAMVPYPRADLVIRLDAPADVRRQRLAERDLRWGTKVIDRWEQLELAESSARSVPRPPDLSLDGERPLPENAGRVIELIHHARTERKDGR